MSLDFSDSDIKTISGDMLSIPIEIAKKQQAKIDLGKEKDNLYNKDQQNLKYFNNFHNIINQYHNEMKNLNGVVKSTYDPAEMDKAAKQDATNQHYPITPVIWPNLPPKILPQNTGVPTSAQSVNEGVIFGRFSQDISLFKNGFPGGSTTATATSALTGNTIKTEGSFSSGNKVVIDGGGNACVAIITGITAPVPPDLDNELQLSFTLNPTGPIPSGATIRNYHPGFTNSQREGTAGVSDPGYFNALKSMITTDVTDWKGTLNGQSTALIANDATSAEASDITKAKDAVNAAKQSVQLWEGRPITGAGLSRFGDNGLAVIESRVATRKDQGVVRDTQIKNYLGALTQAEDGAVTGSGNYQTLFKWIDIRIAKAGGSLTSYYGIDLGIKGFDQNIQKLQSKYTEYSKTFFVTKFSKNADGTKKIYVELNTSISNGDSIKLMSNTVDVINRTIVAISETYETVNNIKIKRYEVELNDVVPQTYKVDDVARLVKRIS